jgi:hypothetical protein
VKETVSLPRNNPKSSGLHMGSISRRTSGWWTAGWLVILRTPVKASDWSRVISWHLSNQSMGYRMWFSNNWLSIFEQSETLIG